MDLRGFLDAAYALLIEEFQRVGTTLFDALDKTASMRQGKQEAKEAPADASANDRALAQLKQMLPGGMPG